MAGSAKRHFKDKARYFGRPDRAVKANWDRWERWGDKLSGKANADRIIAAQQDQGPAIPMPDEEEIKRNRRRSQAARSGGRAATILSQGDGDRLGP